MEVINCTYEFTVEVSDIITAESADEATDLAIERHSDEFPPQAGFSSSVEEYGESKCGTQWKVLVKIFWEESSNIKIYPRENPQTVAQQYADYLGAELVTFEMTRC